MASFVTLCTEHSCFLHNFLLLVLSIPSRILFEMVMVELYPLTRAKVKVLVFFNQFGD